MNRLQVSKRAQNVIASPIRKFLPYVREAESRGLKVFKLNTGDPDLEVPAEFFKTIKGYQKKNLNYAPSPGLAEHVKAWQKYYRQFGVKLDAHQIIPTVGCAEAILLALMAVADPGDEILVFEPLYVSYKSFSIMTGIKLVPVTLSITDDFALPQEAELEKKIGKKTKAIVVINPDNPTGKVWSDKELETILRIAIKHDLFVISDETYREIRFSGQPSCLLSKRACSQNIILVDSVSKRFSMPGARVGCIASFNEEVMEAVLKFAQARLSVGTLEQLATIPLLQHSRPYTRKIQKEYLQRRNAVYQALSGIPGVVCSKPLGAFYIYAQLPVKSAEGFARFMIKDFSFQKKTVMVSPMQDFYITKGLGQNEIRIAYVFNVKELTEAIEVLARGLAAYGK